MIRIEDYVQLGLKGIVFLGDSKESDVPEKGEIHITQRLACFNGDGVPHEYTIRWISQARNAVNGKYALFEFSRRLGQAEYEEMVKSGGVLDDVFFQQKRAQNNKRQRDAQEELDNMAPICPTCKNPMTLKLQVEDGQPVWECLGFGNCRGKVPASDEIVSEYRRLVRIAEQT